MPGTKRKRKAQHDTPTTPINKNQKNQKTPSTAATVLDTPRTAATVLDTPRTASNVLDTPYSTSSTVSTVIDPNWDIEDERNGYTYAENGNILYNGKQVYTSDDWVKPLTRDNQDDYTITTEPYIILRKYLVSRKGGKRRTTKRRRVKRQVRRTTSRNRH